jgi:small subunit ribosomal protein S9
MQKIITSGKRKRAIARAIIVTGTGKVTINKRNFLNMQLFDRLRIEEPLKIAESILGKLNFDVNISVKGGGEKGQLEASRLALAKAIIKFTGSEKLEKEYANYDKHLLVADVRRKEPYKPGDSKARKKRQKSFR